MLKHHGDAGRGASTRSPSTVISPVDGLINPSMQRSRVVLPQPEGPTIATISDLPTSRLMSRNTVSGPYAAARP